MAEVINVELPVEKYDTFSGFVCGVLERVPEDGEQFRCSWKNLDIVVNQVRNHTVVEGIVHVQPEKKCRNRKKRSDKTLFSQVRDSYREKDLRGFMDIFEHVVA